MKGIGCPKCGSMEWMALEQFSAQTPCSLALTEDGQIETIFDMRAEMARNAATSVTTAFMCASCDNVVPADVLDSLLEGK